MIENFHLPSKLCSIKVAFNSPANAHASSPLERTGLDPANVVTRGRVN
jgi:hypothetical protein